MIVVPAGNERELIAFSLDLIDKCRVSMGTRAAYYRLMNIITETGRYDGPKALINVLYKHLERTAAHIFSPVELKFLLEFDNRYPRDIYERAAVVGQLLTRQWARNNTDIRFGQGVFESLKYGACIHKQWVQMEGPDNDQKPCYYDKLVMPWQFGVYNEAENNIHAQAALCETVTLTMAEVWRRIWFLPEAKKLYQRIQTHAAVGAGTNEPQSYFHSVLSSSQLNTTSTPTTALGGILQINNGANYSVMGPTIGAPTVQCHEIWVQDEDDYTTIVMIEPDIVISPRHKKANLLIKGSRLQPYRLIQPNEVTNWFWGRSELVDLIEPQGLLATTCDDLRRLFGLQVDKILGFIGEGGPTDETYGQMRQAGYFNMQQGSSITDLTPKMPAEMMPMLKFLLETINNLSGFPPIMQGAGEPGVRAGSHANTLMKTASPTLRDRALLVERQCAITADLTWQIREAKDAQKYWTKADKPIEDPENTSFLLADIPEDSQVTVDSHSSSPIFSDENTQLVFAAHKMGIVDGAYVIDNVALPNKDAAKTALREKEKAKAEETKAIMEKFPDIAEKLALRTVVGGKH